MRGMVVFSCRELVMVILIFEVQLNARSRHQLFVNGWLRELESQLCLGNLGATFEFRLPQVLLRHQALLAQ